MNYKVETLENSMASFTITVPAKDFDEALTKSFNKNKAKFNIPGFRKGKATRQMVEKHYGMGALLEDAIDFMLDATYENVVRESGLEVVSRPEISFDTVEKDKDFVYTAKVALKPELTLGEYKGIEIEKTDASITDEDVNAELERERQKNSRLVVVERPIETGDHTVIDFDGSVDGVRFDGGKGEDYPLVIGSHSFIEGFEEALIGHSLGEEFDINVTFPETYHAKDLASKPAVFRVKIKEIKKNELPELNDDFASEVSEFDTLAEYKEDLKKKLSERKEKEVKSLDENRVLERVVEAASVNLPDPMVDFQVENMLNDYARRMQAQGIPLDQYLQFTGMTVENLKDQMKPNAIRNIKTRLTLEKVAEMEKLEATEEDMDKELSKIAEQYKMELDKIKGLFGEAEKKQMSNDIKVEKAFRFVIDNAKLK